MFFRRTMDYNLFFGSKNKKIKRMILLKTSISSTICTEFNNVVHIGSHGSIRFYSSITTEHKYSYMSWCVLKQAPLEHRVLQKISSWVPDTAFYKSLVSKTNVLGYHGQY